MEEAYDMIIVGCGAIGAPLAWILTERNKKVLCIEKEGSPGQGDCKRAIGGVRATHGDPAKIIVCRRSLEIFKAWQGNYRDDIEWNTGGYCFPAYEEREESILKGLLEVQHAYGLNIDWVGPERVQELVPGICPTGLRGGTYSPDDGTCSPLLAANAFYFQARKLGARFLFSEPVTGLLRNDEGHVCGVSTDKGTYHAPMVIDCAGAFSNDLLRSAAREDPSIQLLPIAPDLHEAAITEPVERFFEPMIVDIRPSAGSKNYYFYQNLHGQVIFCITPDPPILGTNPDETSEFLPLVAPRVLRLLPRLRNIKVRRLWRGTYQMTPDGSPLLGWSTQLPGLFHATGMCGQGFMLGPGLAELIARYLDNESTHQDRIVLEKFALGREFGGPEALK